MTSTTARRAVIIHGYSATPTDHWFGWLAEELGTRGMTTAVPAMPCPQAPEPGPWLRTVHDTVGVPDAQTIVVGHSLGCLTVLRHLAALRTPWRLGALVLVAGFVDTCPALPNLDDYIKDGCPVDGLADHIDRLALFRSDADEYVPIEHTDRLAASLGTTAVVVPGAGHFLGSDGITRLPQVLDALI
ncbi:RBBP9/YdeN family alpha/beta hydrolase [Mycolicibacterium sp. 22603]|uniref:RBBP9/YdeN family alpha/beta hydrolase n=1 Tax=Mycolicibacterium sp. 22603 TaxID=3453950 RepID=UPI003F876E64